MSKKLTNINSIFFLLTFCLLASSRSKESLDLTESIIQAPIQNTVTTPAPVSAEIKNNCFLDTIENVISKLQLRIDKYTELCKLTEKKEIQDIIKIAAVIGKAEGNTVATKTFQLKYFDDIKPYTSTYDSVQSAMNIKANPTSEDFDGIMAKLRKNFEAIAKGKDYPLFFIENVWMLTKYTRAIEMIKLAFTKQSDCLPIGFKYVTTMDDIMNDPTSDSFNIQDSCKAADSNEFKIDPLAFSKGGIGVAFWIKEDYTVLTQSGLTVFQGFLDNKKNYELTVLPGNDPLKPSLINQWQLYDQTFKMESTPTCTDYAFVFIVVEKDCDHYKVTSSIRMYVSNKRYFDKRNVSASVIEGLKINLIQPPVVNSKTFKDIKYSEELEMKILTALAQPFFDELSKVYNECQKGTNCDYYSAEKKCFICKSNFFKYKGDCLTACPDGTYQDKTDCVDCKKNCKKCKATDFCDECEKDFLRLVTPNKASCVDKCPDNMVPVQGQCQSCGDKCAQCQDISNCAKCEASNYLLQGKCVATCPAGFYTDIDNKKCLACPTGCEKCESFSKCNSCTDGYFLKDSSSCVQNCGDKFYGDTITKTCKSCVDFCKKCLNSNECTECSSSYFLTSNKKCSTTCENGQVSFNGICIDCKDKVNCITCDPSNVQICKKCQDKFYLKSGICVDNCGDGFYVNNNECQRCISNCKSCNKDKCLLCNDNTYLLEDKTCVENCPDGYVISGRTCVKCTNDKCRKCNEKNLDICTLCYDPKLLKEGTCVEKCGDYYYKQDTKCMKCIDNCKECKDGLSCKTCDANYFMKGSICVDKCGSGMRPNKDLVCEVCKVTGCDQCIKDANICDQCVMPQVLYNNQCYNTCPSGTYLPPNSTTCSMCGKLCEVCLDNTTCTKCSAPMVLQGKECIETCKDGYRNPGDGICVACENQTCKKCENSSKKCSDCKNEEFLFNFNCVKTCPDGTFPQKGICVACQKPCQKCTETACTECMPGFGMTDNNQCTDNCPKGTVMISETKKCDKCTDKGCAKCNAKDVSECLSCESPYSLLKGDCYQQCPSGFYSLNNICTPCIKNCAQCSDSTTCSVCEKDYNLKSGISCVKDCGEGWMISKSTCIQCKGNCKECKLDDLLYCTNCSQGLVLLNGQCLNECPPKYWNNAGICTACPVTECTKCSDGKNCTQCTNGYVLNEGKCIVKPCPPGKVEKDGTCIKCEVSNCNTCSSDNTKSCSQCILPNVLVNEYTCASQCPTGMFQLKIAKTEYLMCAKCIQDCSVCEDSSTCKKCDAGFNLQDGICVKNCKEGMRAQDGKCIPCALENCAECPSGTCSKCKSPLYLQLDQQKCYANCPDGFYPDLSTLLCTKCSIGCKKCPNASDCDECSEGKTLITTTTPPQCADNCPAGSVQINKKCIVCQTTKECKTCTPDDLTKCAECNKGLVLYNGKCIVGCPKGFFAENGSICKSCIQDCDFCTSPASCTKCKTGSFIYQGQCVSPCPSGYYNGISNCEPCTANCATCTAEKCNKCIDKFYIEEGICKNQCSPGYFLKNFLECTKCPKNCITCDNESTCKVCINGFFLLNGACVENCSVGYIAQDGVCKKCIDNCDQCRSTSLDKCDSCTSSYYLLNGKCVQTCPSEYYINGNTCMPCIKNCLTCKDGTSCDKCKTGFSYDTVKKECVEKCNDGYSSVMQLCSPCTQDGCKNCDGSISSCDICNSDKFKLQDSCKSQCPDENYYVDINTKTCKACPVECLKCTQTECKKCKTGFSLQKGKCVNKCDDGSISVSGECLACKTPYCSICDINNLDKCVKCIGAKVLVPVLNSISTIPLTFTCGDTCPDGYYPQDGKCSLCNNELCKKCTDSKKCDECFPGKLIQDDVCKTSCDPGYVERNGKCLKCLDINCIICDNLSLKDCKKCGNAMKIFNGECTQACPTGYFETKNGEQTICSRCVSNCNKCSNSNSCETCKDGTYLQDGLCVDSCSEGYATVDKICKKCTQSECSKCDPTNVDKCSTCKSSWYLTMDSKCVKNCGDNFFSRLVPTPLCIPCSDKFCIECSPQDSCNKCTKGMVIYQNQCAQFCPPGYYFDKDNKCQACSNKDCTKCDSSDSTLCSECVTGKFLSDKKCVNTCPQGYFANAKNQCQSCSANCKECLNETTCTKCIDKFLLDDTLKCTDKCNPGYVESNGKCVKCTEDCVKCDPANLSTCTDCKVEQFLYNGKCVVSCKKGTFIKGRVCIDCEQNCSDCDDATTCTTCFDPFIERKNDCVKECPNGYTNVKGHCKECKDSNKCDKCLDDKTTCIQCRQPLLLAEGKCIERCDSGYFYNSEDKKCSSCPDKCDECENKKSCKKCKSDYAYYAVDGTCVKNCPDKFYMDSTSRNCVACVNPHCQTCDSKQCVTCPKGSLMIVKESSEIDCIDQCPDGYYKDGDKCIKCTSPCKTCTSAKECMACVKPYILKDKDCLGNCPDGYVEREGQCYKCSSPQCAICDPADLNKCKKCLVGILFNDLCITSCSDKFYLDTKLATCVPCKANCLKCDATGCTQCDKGYFFMDQTKDCVDCLKPNVLKNNVCFSCKVKSCIECLTGDDNTCRICDSTLILHQNACIPSCPDGYFKQGQTCVKCDANCTTCTGPNQCSKCNTSYLLFNGSCVDTCPDGFMNDKQGKCTVCQQKDCLRCDDKPDVCTKCDKSLIVFDGRCVDTCPAGYFLMSNACGKCPTSCLKCDAIRCSECPPNTKIKEKECVKDCGDGYYDDGKNCIPCDVTNCLQCKPQTTCILCNKGTYLNTLTGKCELTCPDGYFPDSSKGICAKCADGCDKCTSEKCISCSINYSLFQSKCVSKCPDGYTSLNNNCVSCIQKECKECFPNKPESCSKCIDKWMLLSDKCYNPCPVGTYQDNDKCVNCDSKCAECSSLKECIKCKPEFVQSGKQCDNKCPDGKVSMNGKCVSCMDEKCKTCSGNVNICLECQKPNKLYDGACLGACPSGYYDNGQGVCTSCANGCAQCDSVDKCSKCSSGYFYYNGACLAICPSGYYGDCTELKCKPCDASCSGCSGGTSSDCVKCAANYLLSQKSCISSQSCPAGTYPNLTLGTCSRCTIPFCAQCDNEKSCKQCNRGFIVKNGACEMAQTITPVIKTPLLVSSYTTNDSLLRQKEIIPVSTLSGTGVGSTDVSLSFFIRQLTPELSDNPILISVVNNTADTYNFKYIIDIKAGLCKMLVEDQLGKLVFTLPTTKWSYAYYYNWNFVTINFAQDGSNFLARVLVLKADGKFDEYSLNIPGNSKNKILDKDAKIIINDYPSNTKNPSNVAYQISNVYIMDYSPDLSQLTQIAMNSPPFCDYFCTKCDAVCLGCPEGVLPVDQRCKANKMTVNAGVRIFSAKAYQFELRKELKKPDMISDAYGISTWFYIDSSKVDAFSLVNVSISASSVKNNFFNVSISKDGMILVNGVSIGNKAIAASEWYFIVIAIRQDYFKVILQDRYGYKYEKDLGIPSVFIRLFDDFIFNFGDNVFTGGMYNTQVYVNNIPGTADMDFDFNSLKCPDSCLICGVDLTCKKCIDKFTLQSDGKCKEEKVVEPTSLIDRVDLWNDENFSYVVPTSQKFAVSFWLRKKTRSVIIRSHTQHNLISYSQSDGKIIPIISESLKQGYISDINFHFASGPVSHTHDFNNEIYDYIHIVLVFDKSAQTMYVNMRDFSISKDLEKTDKFTGNFDKIIIGDQNGLELNYEFTNVNTYPIALEKTDIDKIRTEGKPIDCDPACKDCNLKTGVCVKCGIFNSKGTCALYMLGYNNTAIYNYDSYSKIPNQGMYTNTLANNGFTKGVNSVLYSTVGDFKLLKIADGKRYRIFNLSNLGKKEKSANDRGSGIIILDIIGKGSEGIAEFLVNDGGSLKTVPVPGFSVKTLTWASFHAGIDVQNKLFQYLIQVKDGQIIKGQQTLANMPEKLQEIAGITVEGMGESLDPAIYAVPQIRMQSVYFIPNYGYKDAVYSSFVKGFAILPDPVCDEGCEFCEYNDVKAICMVCLSGYTANAGVCTKNPVVLPKNFIEFNEGVLLTQTTYTIDDTTLLKKPFIITFLLRKNYFSGYSTKDRDILTFGKLKASLSTSTADNLKISVDGEMTSAVVSLVDPYNTWNQVTIVVNDKTVQVIINSLKDKIGTVTTTNTNLLAQNVNTLIMDPRDEEIHIFAVSIFESSDITIKSLTPPSICGVDCGLCDGTDCKISALGIDKSGVFNKGWINFASKSFKSGKVTFPLLANLATRNIYRSKIWTLEFSMGYAQLPGLHTVLQMSNQALLTTDMSSSPAFSIDFNALDGSITVKAVVNSTVNSKDSTQAISMQLPKKSVNTLFYFAITLNNQKLTVLCAESSGNLITGVLDIPVKSEMSYLIRSAAAIISSPVNAEVSEMTFYYEASLDADTLKKNALKYVSPFQKICQVGTRSQCTTCTGNVPATSSVCLPSTGGYSSYANNSLAISAMMGINQTLKYVYSSALSSLTEAFWLRLTSLQPGSMGILRINYGKDKLVSLMTVVYSADANTLEISLNSTQEKVTIENVLSTAFQWVHININYQITNGVLNIVTYDEDGKLLISRKQDLKKIKSIASPQIIYFIFGFTDNTLNVNESVNFEISGLGFFPNADFDSTLMEQYRFNPANACELPCKDNCVNGACLNYITKPYSLSAPSDSLFTQIDTDFTALNIFSKYLISFEFDPSVINSAAYSANPNTLFMIHNILLDKYASLQITDQIPSDLKITGFTCSYKDKEKILMFERGSDPWKRQIDTFQIDLSSFTQFTSKIYVSILFDVAKNQIRILIIVNGNASVYDFSNSGGLTRTTPINLGSMVYIHPKINQLRINLNNPRTDYDLYQNAIAFSLKCAAEAKNQTCPVCANGFHLFISGCNKEYKRPKLV